MKLLFMALGSRGDIEPFLAQAELFASEHEILCIFPEQFRQEVESLGYQFMGFDKAFLELLGSQTGKQVMGGGGFFKKAQGYYKLMRSSMSLQRGIIEVQRNGIHNFEPDRVIFHTKCLYAVLAAMDQPEKYTLLNAIPCINHPTNEYPHIGFGKWGKFSSNWNLKTYSLVNGARHMTFKKFLGKYYSDYPDQNFSPKNLKEFEENKLKTIYAISKNIFPKPADWPDSAKIMGYHFRDQKSKYKVDPELDQWLKRHPKAILLTFGSMSNPRPKEISEMFVKLLNEKGIPTIINTSWGGLEKVSNSSDTIFYTNHIPYDFIMPKLYGVIHHGGSGTTHLTSMNGCVQLIIPHIIDQYFWNNLISEKQLGPKGLPVSKLKGNNLSEILDDFWNNPIYATNAKQISSKMKTEVEIQAIKNNILDIS